MTSILKHLARLILGTMLVLAMVSVGFAHHSNTQFEPVRSISITGTLTKISWSNPHSLFIVNAKKDGGEGAAQDWAVEGPSPRQLEGKGWRKVAAKPGDTITFTGRPRRDGKPDMLLETVQLADGTNFNFKVE